MKAVNPVVELKYLNGFLKRQLGHLLKVILIDQRYEEEHGTEEAVEEAEREVQRMRLHIECLEIRLGKEAPS